MIGNFIKSVFCKFEDERSLKDSIALAVNAQGFSGIILKILAWVLIITPGVYIFAKTVYYSFYKIGCCGCYSIPTCTKTHPLACLAVVALVFVLLNVLGAYIHRRTNRQLLGKFILVWTRCSLYAYLISAAIIITRIFWCK